MTAVARLACLWFLAFLPVLAQTGPGLNPSLQELRKAPVPTDQFGNPITVSPPSAADLKAEHLAQKERADKIRAEDERQALEHQLRANEQREVERRADELQAQNQRNTLVYVVLAVVATLFVSRFFNRRS
ncbi:MAG TPA: hypothetical protein DDZ88_27760 [Verrucomicrobiales bacterium]|nr:hypothetical protein [Verrucomicrobiales bacterium]